MIYYHPHGLGDLIMAMPYIEETQKNERDFILSVRQDVYASGYFNRYPHRNRVNGECPGIWDRWQLRCDYSELDRVCGTSGFYIRPRRDINRRKQFAEWFGCEYDPDIQGRVYLPNDIVPSYPFVHSKSSTPLKSAPRWLFKNPNGPISYSDINYWFLRLKYATSVHIIDSVFLHACGALHKDVDELYVSPQARKVIPTLIPENIKIKKIHVGTITDVLGAVCGL